MTVSSREMACGHEMGAFLDISYRRVVVLFGHFGKTCQPHVQGSRSLDLLTLEYGTDTLSRNAGRDVALYAAYHAVRTEISSASWGMHDVTQQTFVLGSRIEANMPEKWKTVFSKFMYFGNQIVT